MNRESDSRIPPAEPIPCDQARLQASAWVDGELPRSSALLEHLEDCKACRTHVAELRALRARLAPLRAVELTADLWPGIASRARARARPTIQWPQRVQRAAAVLIGCASMAALLETASRLERATRDDGAGPNAAWPVALHQEPGAVRELRSAPESRLLASIDPNAQGQR